MFNPVCGGGMKPGRPMDGVSVRGAKVLPAPKLFILERSKRKCYHRAVGRFAGPRDKRQSIVAILPRGRIHFVAGPVLGIRVGYMAFRVTVSQRRKRYPRMWVLIVAFEEFVPPSWVPRPRFGTRPRIHPTWASHLARIHAAKPDS